MVYENKILTLLGVLGGVGKTTFTEASNEDLCKAYRRMSCVSELILAEVAKRIKAGTLNLASDRKEEGDELRTLEHGRG